MVKINSINVEGIRGIKDSLELNLKAKSILVYGDNGSGKSSLTDALEWYYYDRIEHLQNEEIGRKRGKDAIRNIFIDDEKEAFIEVVYTDEKISSRKTIDSRLNGSNTNSSVEFNEYYKSTRSENLILRYKDLLKFIIATKTEKLTELQNIIGFSKVSKIRDVLRKSANSISRKIKSANYDNQKNFQQSLILDNLGQNAFTPKQLFEGVEALISPLELDQPINSINDISEVLKKIESTEDTALIESISSLTDVKAKLIELFENVDNLDSEFQKYYQTYNDIIDDKDKLGALRLLVLLKEGKDVLEKDIYKEGYCPLCEQEENKTKLVKGLKERIEALEEFSIEENRLFEQRDLLIELLKKDSRKIENLINNKHLQDESRRSVYEGIVEINQSLQKMSIQSLVDHMSGEQILSLEEVKVSKEGIQELAKAIDTELEKLNENQKSNKRVQIHSKLSQVKNAYFQYERIEKEHEILKRQLETLQLLFNDFIRRQEEALEYFLKIFSKDINEYYTMMNPDEKIEDFKLVPLKDKQDDLIGITIEYKFFDETKTQPIAYLSESHVNCLGLSFFLASVKAFNNNSRFFVLDDVISSFDRPHRARFAKLLTAKFADYQVILLTHEKEFFDLISSEITTSGWLVDSMKWSADKGSELAKGLVDAKDRILTKFRENNSDGLGNDIRIYTEKVLKEIARNIEASVPFRYNEANEKRMAPELLDAVQARISKKSKSLKEKANIPKIKGMPMFLGNTTSHDNKFNESVQDLQVMWEDIRNFIHDFYCKDCEKFVSIKYYDNVEKNIRCGCGNLKYEWK